MILGVFLAYFGKYCLVDKTRIYYLKESSEENKIEFFLSFFAKQNSIFNKGKWFLHISVYKAKQITISNKWQYDSLEFLEKTRQFISEIVSCIAYRKLNDSHQNKPLKINFDKLQSVGVWIDPIFKPLQG